MSCSWLPKTFKFFKFKNFFKFKKVFKYFFDYFLRNISIVLSLDRLNVL